MLKSSFGQKFAQLNNQKKGGIKNIMEMSLGETLKSLK